MDDEFFFAEFFYFQPSGLGALLIEFGEAGGFVEATEEFGKGEKGGLLLGKNEAAGEPLVPSEDIFLFFEAVGMRARGSGGVRLC